MVRGIADLQTPEDLLSMAVLETAIRDLSRGFRTREPGCDPEYFFRHSLHAPWCVQIGIDPHTVTRLLRHFHLL